jgi:hypothetical protein
VIHIQGMGWLGSVLALRLDQAGVPFTWNDKDSPICAWPVSTGLVYTAGDHLTMTNLKAWTGWADRRDIIGRNTTAASFVFSHKSPPHGGKYSATAAFGDLHRAQAPCFAVDVASVVVQTRTKYFDRWTDGPRRGDRLVIAHGFGARLGSLVWGWAAPAKIAGLGGEPVALYGKAHRFQTLYAVPRGGIHRIGSTSLNQGLRPRPDADRAKRARDRWIGHFPTVFPGLELLDVGEPQEGWRPHAALGDEGYVRVSHDGTVSLPPLWHSGIRWAPTVIDQVVAECT